MMRIALLSLGFLASASAVAGQDPPVDAHPTYRPTQAYVRELARQNSLRFELAVTINGRTASVHGASSDCEMHLAGISDIKIGFPGQVVVEPPNLCANDAPSALGTSWGNVFDSHVMNTPCTAVGFPRLYAEHLANGKPPANPPHMVEIHPVMEMRCGGTTIDFAPFMGIVPNMSRILDASADQCISGFKLWVRRNTTTKEYEYFEERPNRCGNFAVLDAVVDPRFVRAVRGGHSALAQVWTGEEGGPYPFKLYTYAGTPEDATIEQIGSANNEAPEETLQFHGMLTIDYFWVLKTVRTQAGTWRVVANWTRVPFPLAMVVFGKALP